MKKRGTPEANARSQHRELGRRELIKWSLFTGAALGLSRWKVFEVLEDSIDSALAADACALPTNRSVHLVAGNGGFAWFQLLWPHNAVAAAGSDTFAFHAPGQQLIAAGTDRPLTLGPEAPFRTATGGKQMTAFMAGSNETHTRTPSTATSVGGNSVFAIAAALQSTNPSVIPVVTIGGAPFGNAPGAPRPSAVGSAEQFVGLFNSAASRAGGLLENTGDAGLYEAGFAAAASLNRAAGRPTQTRAYGTAKTAARLLGTNLADRLAITDADRARYGVDLGTRANVLALAENLIVTAKAFALGLTSSVVLPAMEDDPHGAFNDMGALRGVTTALGKILDGFMGDLGAVADASCGGTTLADNVVLTIHGDTPKNPRARAGWPDGTPDNSNWMYVYGNGLLKTGWHGGVGADGTVKGFDPRTGEDNDAPTRDLAAPASAAVAYAIARGDMRRAADFARGVDIGGVVKTLTM
ncbi:MAG: hypothetical protein IPL61_21280 [Myxococcales bacterium]|nr:hypothetical protein [Myxococcales bacterium]